MSEYHVSALLGQSVDGLDIKPEGVYVDVTFGGGGHSREILSRLGEKGRLFAFDQDVDAFRNILNDSRFVFVHANFKYLANFLEYHGVKKIDGLLADFGVSFYHFDTPERGFSFRYEGELDMRMNKGSGKKALDVLRDYSEERLADVFYFYGEIKKSRALARMIVSERNINPILNTRQLVDLVERFEGRGEKYLARVFQALRIEVNQEMDALKEMLEQTVDLMSEGGRLSLISYHSLEDRLVKNFVRTGNFEGKQYKDFYGNLESPFYPVVNKVLIPSEEEVLKNPRARSAKLRIAERKKQ